MIAKWLRNDFPYVYKVFDTEEKINGFLGSWQPIILDLTVEEVRLGIQGCSKYETYVPSKAQFLQHAKGLPDPNTAYELAIRGIYDYPSVYYTMKNMPDRKEWEMLAHNNQFKRSRFVANYEIMRDKILAGEKLDTFEYDLFVTEHYENKYKNALMRDIRFYDDAYYGNPVLNDIGIRDKQINDPDFDSAKKILIVDDDNCTRAALKYFCRELNYKAYTAFDIRSALTIYPKVALILMDINLPDDVDGFEICRQIRKHDPELPIIGMTALSDFEELKPEAAAAGLTELLEKPLEFEGLRDITNKYLGNIWAIKPIEKAF